MDIIFILIPVTLGFIITGVVLFFWSVKNGQYDDVDSPASRILFDEDLPSQSKQSDQSRDASESEGDSPLDLENNLNQNQSHNQHNNK